MTKPQNFLLLPRYLRAIPSLVVLTTAMAWGMGSEPDVTDAVSKKAGVSQLQRAGVWGSGEVPLVRRWLKVR